MGMACCTAMTASCLACQQGLTMADVCEKDPEMDGCKPKMWCDITRPNNKKRTCATKIDGVGGADHTRQACKDLCADMENCQFIFHSSEKFCALYEICDETRVANNNGVTLKKGECEEEETEEGESEDSEIVVDPIV